MTTEGVRFLLTSIMNIDPRYVAIIKEWELLYGKSRVMRYDLTEARLCCVKCGKFKIRKMSRHHIENDFFFAQMRPDLFAKRYIEFHKDDVAKLCEDCHKDIHAIYKRITSQLWIELHKGGTKIITLEWCKKWKALYREAFEVWMAKPIRKKKRKRKKKPSLAAKPQPRRR
jgi:hypothetical protein